MPASIATLIYTALILGLFWLDRDKARTSAALWIPIISLSLSGSRSASEWLYAAAPGRSTEAYLEGDPLNRFVYASLVGLGLLVLSVRWSKVPKLLQANTAIVVFLLYCVLSLTWADYPDVGFKRWVKALGDFVMVLIVVSEKDPAVAIRRLLTRTGFLLIPLSMLMIKYYPDLARYYDRWEWTTLYSGVATNKNALGGICLLFGLASAWQFLEALSGRQRAQRIRLLIAHGIILAMVIWLFKLANSITALSCFLIGIAALLVLQLARRRVPDRRVPDRHYQRFNRLMVHWLTLSLIVLPSTILFVDLGVLELLGRNPTLTDRTFVWNLVLSQTTNPWIVGTGFENFWLGSRLDRIWSVFSFALTQAHNGYLEIYLNLGWTGIALLSVVLVTGYQSVVTKLRRSPSTGSLMLAYFVIGIVYNFTEAALFQDLVSGMVRLAIGAHEDSGPAETQDAAVSAPPTPSRAHDTHTL